VPNLQSQDQLINEKLDTIIGFLAIRGLENDAEISERLINLGLANPAIARIMNTTDNAVALRRSRMKKSKSKAPKASMQKASTASNQDGD
jgi:hypothetical protein